ncbi:hypothetical protein [Kribbella ginsengisoli]|uniref:RelA/SpoT domain-containing protein n=1 Tax=Kribbella ginsengisoli TaxID=363865 RepID=A0ABP6XEF1_9ACTN
MALNGSPPDPLPEPRDLLRAFEVHGKVDWGEDPGTAAEIVEQYGQKVAERSLRTLERLVASEPRVTAEFLAAMPSTGSAYHLASRIKSPASLARKLADRQRGRAWNQPIEDVLRYTVLTEHPQTVVAATRRTTDGLDRAGWRVGSAMHSYTEGSRYKGIHAWMKASTGDPVEVQFHSAQSVAVKEATTPHYEIERSADAAAEERTAARRECIRLSATLIDPPGIADLTEIGGRRVVVNNYSDSRAKTGSGHQAGGTAPDQRASSQGIAPTRRDGMSR